MNWETYWFEILKNVATGSKDRSRKFGAIIVDKKQRLLSTGYNGIPRGIEYKEVYHDRPDKYMYFIHAELNSILNAASLGIAIEGSAMYVICPPCAQCAGAIINAGILQINYIRENEIKAGDADTSWIESLNVAIDMFIEAGIVIRRFPDG